MKYLKPDTTSIHGSYGTKRGESKFDEYILQINKLLSQNTKFKYVEIFITKSRYEGSSSLIRRYIYDKKDNFKIQD